MVVHPKVPAKSAGELVALTKAKPQDFNYASAGNGTAPHFSAEIFKLESGAQMAHVPYRGAAPAMNDTMAGQTQVMFPSLFSAYPHVKNGKLRALALAGPKRSSLLPDVPTLEEAGVKGVEITQWYALFAPGKTPRPVVDQLNKALNTALADKDVARRIEEQGAVVDPSTPEQLALTVRQEIAKWKGVVHKAQLTPDCGPRNTLAPVSDFNQAGDIYEKKNRQHRCALCRTGQQLHRGTNQRRHAVWNRGPGAAPRQRPHGGQCGSPRFVAWPGQRHTPPQPLGASRQRRPGGRCQGAVPVRERTERRHRRFCQRQQDL